MKINILMLSREFYLGVKVGLKRNVEILFLHFHKGMEDSIQKQKIQKKLIL